MAGWIALARKYCLTDEWREKRVFSRAEAWIYMLLEANWRDEVDDDGVLVERGSIRISSRKLARVWQWERGRVLRQLGAWERDGRIEKHPIHPAIQGPIHLRIVNYELYQRGGREKPP